MDLNMAHEKTMSPQNRNEENNSNLAEESNLEANNFGNSFHIFFLTKENNC